jgi:ElaB/YqjD/DUF883 family membrane-anchored ribosome-binding protein
MTDNRTVSLPDGTDKVIEGAARSEDGDTLTVEDTALVREKEIATGRGDSKRQTSDSAARNQMSGSSSIVDRFRSGSEQLSNQAGERARGLVSQGLERTAEALANVSKMIGDTAPGIEERLGSEYGDYARRAAGAVENAANSVASKDPDELIEDTRNFVRNSPGIALAGAAVVGFVLARVLKSGLAASRGEDEED